MSGIFLNIQTWGGLGDVLREISLLPMDAMHDKLGLPTRIWHLPASQARVRPDAGCPPCAEIANLTERLRCAIWAGEAMAPRGTREIARTLRMGLELFPDGRRLFPPDFSWRTEDALPSTFLSAQKNLVLQTHLAGLPGKRWPVEKWRAVITEIRRRREDLGIHILDPAGSSLADDGVTVQDRLSIPQALRLVSQADAVVSLDSWSKYVSAWNHIPQIVIVPDQTSDYAQLTASTVWRHSFRGLQHAREIELIGLKPAGNKAASYTFGSLDRLQPADLLPRIESLLRNLRKR